MSLPSRNFLAASVALGALAAGIAFLLYRFDVSNMFMLSLLLLMLRHCDQDSIADVLESTLKEGFLLFGFVVDVSDINVVVGVDVEAVTLGTLAFVDVMGPEGKAVVESVTPAESKV